MASPQVPVENREWQDILGYGQKIKVLIGAEPEKADDPTSPMKPIFMQLHLTPVTMADYATAQKLVNEFFREISPPIPPQSEGETIENAAAVPQTESEIRQGFEVWSEKARQTGAQIVALALKKFHPQLDETWVIANLSVGTLATAISVVLDVSDFLRGTGALIQKIAVLKGQAPTLKVING